MWNVFLNMHQKSASMPISIFPKGLGEPLKKFFLIKNWASGKDWSSLLSVITNLSTKSAVVVLMSSNLFGIELILRVEKINLFWLLFFCLHKSNKLFSGPWLELGSEFSQLRHWQHWCLDEPQYYHYWFYLSKTKTVNLHH